MNRQVEARRARGAEQSVNVEERHAPEHYALCPKSMPDLHGTPVVTCFLRHRCEVLLLHRGDKTRTYPGRWGGVSGYASDDPDATARQEIAEETGLHEAVSLVRRGAPIRVEDADLGTHWVIYPYLFDCARRDAAPNWEADRAEWTHPTAMLRRETVPELWASYAQVAPSVASIRDDRTHGAAYLSLRALEVLRDWAGRLGWQESKQRLTPERTRATLEALARQLLEARPSMAVVRNRVGRALRAWDEGAPAEALEQVSIDEIQRALEAEDAAARHAADRVAGRHVLTLSRSGTVEDALLQADPPPSVCVAASQPPGEGIGTAERLARAGLDVTLLPDAALAHVLSEEGIDLVLTGADTVLASGAVVNKTGTRLAALAARDAGVPFYAACTTDKLRPDDAFAPEDGDPQALYDGEAPLRVLSPTFERTPPALVTGLLTERGLLAPEDAAAVAEELRALGVWEM